MLEQLRPESKDRGEASTFIPNSSLLIPHSSKAFIHNQRTARPHGLIFKETLIKSQSQILQDFLYIASS